MSLSTNVTDLATRVATEAKALRTLVNGNAADLSALSTTAKTSLVAAINELASAIGGAGAAIDDATISTLTVWSSNKTNTEIAAAVTALVGGAPGALDTLNELAAAINDDASYAATLTAALATKANDADVVHDTGNETVAGVKTFSSSPVVPDGSFTIAKSTGLQGALDAKAPLASPAFTGTPTGITKAHVGLSAVDNTADTAKPVSTAQQTALNLKANIASPTFTGTVAGITKAMVGLGNVDNTADSAKPVSTAQAAADTAVQAAAVQRANHTGTQAQSTIVNLTTDLAAKANSADVGSTTTNYVTTFEAGLV